MEGTTRPGGQAFCRTLARGGPAGNSAWQKQAALLVVTSHGGEKRCLKGSQERPLSSPAGQKGLGSLRQSFSSKRVPMSSSPAAVRRNSTRPWRQSAAMFLAFRETLPNWPTLIVSTRPSLTRRGESILYSPTPALANLFPLGPSPTSISTNYSTLMFWERC